MSTVSSDWQFNDFVQGHTPLPSPNLGWNTYGTGLEGIGRNGEPEAMDIPEPAADQVLVRIDAVGLCFSDVKLIKQGGDHPKLYGRDLSVEPTRLGHEVSVTVISVGAELADTYTPGQRLAIQPDIYVDGRSSAYGYTTPGGLIQYHLLGSEVLDADDGAYVIDLNDDIGYAAAALSEPWACVEASYTQRRRLVPAEGGTLWVIGSADDATEYSTSAGIGSPTRVVLSDVSPQVDELIRSLAPSAEFTVENELSADRVAEISQTHTGDEGFDDIFCLGQTSGDLIEEVSKVIAFRGLLTLSATEPLDRYPLIDVGRLHYHYTAYVGTTSGDISTAWGEERNRAELISGGTTVVVGAGGPMGQMHMQRAIEKADGPARVLGIDLDDERLEAARSMLASLAEERGIELILFNPGQDPDGTATFVAEQTQGKGADDVIVTVPVGAVMADAAELMSSEGMLVLFAGVANGTLAPLNVSDIYLANAQFTGTSGSSIADQEAVLEKSNDGSLSPERALAAVGGIEAGRDGVRALLEGDYAGKVVIFPQLSGLELTSLEELAEKHPDIAAALGSNNSWTNEAERLLFEAYHAS